MARYMLAAALALLAMTLPAMAAQGGGRVVGCRERCDRNPCQASRAVCERARKSCLAECKE